MRPKERRETGQSDLLRSRLDSIIDMNHALVKLARTVDWGFLEERFGAVYSDKPGQPPLPTRLMAGLALGQPAGRRGRRGSGLGRPAFGREISRDLAKILLREALAIGDMIGLSRSPLRKSCNCLTR